MSNSSQVRREGEFDDVDGALFSRIPSKQCDVGCDAGNFPKESSRKDNVDGMTSIGQTSTSGAVTQPMKSKYKTTGKETLECSIRPEDLSEDDDDNMAENCTDALIDEKDDDVKRDEESDSSSDGLYPSDQSDAAQGSRTNLQECAQEESAIIPHSSSIFYTQPPCGDDKIQDVAPESEDSNSQKNDVSFNLEDNEGDIAGTTEERFTEQEKKHKNINRNSSEHIEMLELNEQNVESSNDQKRLQERDDIDSPQQLKASSSLCCACWPVAQALIFPIVSLLIYFWDIGSDIRLAISYKENGDVDLFWITLACIVIPHVLMAVVDVSWVWLDRKSGNAHTCRIILGCLTLGRIVRALNYITQIYKVKRIPKAKDKEEFSRDGSKRSWHKARAREEKRDCFFLDFINAFMESAPQLFVQLYLYYAYNLELTFIRVINLLSSWISIAWTYAAYYRCNREALAGKQDVKMIGFAFFFCSVLSALAARFICTALFLVNYYTWIGGICIFAHFFVMCLWIGLKERPKLEGTISKTWTFGRFLYYIFFAYVSILCFMNLNDSRARKRMTVFYIVIYIENSLMAFFSYWKITENESEINEAKHLLVLPVGLVLHVVLLLNYYLFLHPKTGMCYNCKYPCSDKT